MSYWTLLQAIFNLFVFAALVATWWRLRRPPQDDPRLSRGLQLLQTKITVLEDLSDRTDAQVKQLTTLIDQKTRTLQNKVIEAEQQIIKIDHSVSHSAVAGSSSAVTSSGGTAESIPHHELAERQRTVAYVKAAKMANAGSSVDQIAQEVSLPREQIELIAKFNREQLMFDEQQLPDWAQKEVGGFTLSNIDFVGNLDKPSPDLAHMVKIGNDFKQAVDEVKKADAAALQSILETRVAESIKASMATGMESVQPAVMAVKATAQTLKEKLVATAEDMLRQSQAHPRENNLEGAKPLANSNLSYETFKPGVIAAPNSEGSQPTAPAQTPLRPTPESTVAYANAVFKPEAPKVRKVIFPRIDKQN